MCAGLVCCMYRTGMLQACTGLVCCMYWTGVLVWCIARKFWTSVVYVLDWCVHKNLSVLYVLLHALDRYVVGVMYLLDCNVALPRPLK